MQFQVPQFIEREPKVVGPFTFRQFIYIGVPALIGFFLYFLAPPIVFFAGTIICEFVGILLAFGKVGGRSIPALLLHAVQFTLGPKQYIWKKGRSVAITEKPIAYQTKKNIAQDYKAKIQLTRNSMVSDLATRVTTSK